ncbi:glycosyltransferase family 2 protein [Methylicorpusculum oleiharenae]|uniref:glycosyltransferase n=1 Tax=Methylicorpusculum oleiharenae TaxID=1338687 RepID=UPI00135A2F0B|nr:glycosyltransferase [Methylicorpusculum oleiharenae]MCD2451810.1 glycosyltransferase family 2 protein [Methylicorpusculum oleiharenae]
MDISIIICTYNRADNLQDCLDCLDAQEISSAFTWEVLLIDNNSSDHTKEFIAQYKANCHYQLRYSFEKKQGLSHARNNGIIESKGNILIFIDDDIRVSKKWLQSIYQTFITYPCDAVGGRIHIESPAKLPKWITPDMYGFLGHQDFGGQTHPMDGYEEYPFGGNMAVRRSVFERIGLFDTELGRKGTGLKKEELFKGEETDFFNRLANVGGKFYYQPDALVLHKILQHQLKPGFFLTLHSNAGKLQAQKDSLNYKRTFAGIPLFIFIQFINSIHKYLHQSIKYGIYNSFRQLMNVSFFYGMICGYYKKKA